MLISERISEIHQEIKELRSGDSDLPPNERREEINDLLEELRELNDRLNEAGEYHAQTT